MPTRDEVEKTPRDEVVKTRVTKTEKTKFEEYVSQTNEFASISQFLRTAAHNYLSSDADPSVNTGEIKTAVEDGISGIETRLEEISNRLADVEQSIQQDDEVDKLASDIYEELMLFTDDIDEEYDDIRDFNEAWVEPNTAEEYAKLDGTPAAFAELFGVEVNKARRALSRALEMYPDIEYAVEQDGTRRYYRDERG